MTANFAIDLVTALWLGFVGACIGSFLNVVAYRLPRGMTIVWKPSHCPQCSHPIRARDNVPVLGWLLLRGKCRDCGKPISPRYAIVEAAMGAAFFLLAILGLLRGGANLGGLQLYGWTFSFSLLLTHDLGQVWSYFKLQPLFYFSHCTLLSWLLVVVLIDSEDRRVPTKLWGFALVVIAGLVWRQSGSAPAFTLWMTQGWASLINIDPAIFEMREVLFRGIFFGLFFMLSLLFVGISFELTALKQRHRVVNHVGALCLSGLWLGPNLYFTVLPIAVVLAVVYRLLCSRVAWVGVCGPLSPLWLAVLLRLCRWW